MLNKQTNLSKSGHEQDGKERRSTPAEAQTSSVQNSVRQSSQPTKRESNLDHLQKMKGEDLKNMGFREEDRK